MDTQKSPSAENKMSDGQNIELVLHMVNKMCGELVDKGQEYFLVTANPVKAMNIGSAKGRQFLQANKDVVQRFLKHCYSPTATVSGRGQGSESSKTVGLTTQTTPKIAPQHTGKLVQSIEKKQPKIQKSSTPEISPLSSRKGDNSKTNEGNSTRKSTVQLKSKQVETSPNNVLSAVNLTAKTPVVSKQTNKKHKKAATDSAGNIAGEGGDHDNSQGDDADKQRQTELKKEVLDAAYLSSPMETTAETNQDDETSSPFGLRGKRKRKLKVFADCEMSPLMSGRELITSSVKSKAINAKEDKGEVTGVGSSKKSRTLDEEKVKGKTKIAVSVSDKRTSKNPLGYSTKSPIKSKKEDNSVELKDCSVDLSVMSGITRKAAKSARSLGLETRRSSLRKEYTGIKGVDTPNDDQNTEENSSETCVKSDAGELKLLTENENADMNLECSVESDQDVEDNSYVDDSHDEDFEMDTEEKVSPKKKSVVPVKKKLKRGRQRGPRGPRNKSIKTYEAPRIYHYTCLICEKVLRGAGALARHAIVHTKQCMECKAEFPDHAELLVHRRTCKSVKRSDKQYPCDKCNLVCIAPWSLRRHQIASHEWRCRFCKTQHDSEESLEEHLETCIDRAIKENEQRDRVDVERHVCETCGKQFANKGILMSHMRCHTEDVSQLISKLCGVDLDQVDKIVDDVTSDPNDNKADKSGSSNLLKCRICSKEFSTPKELTKHKKSCMPAVKKKAYVCEHCDKSFRLRCELNKHARNYHPETYSMRNVYRNERDMGERITCQYCDKMSYNHAWMKVHTAGHVSKGDLKLEDKGEEEDLEAESENRDKEVGKSGAEVAVETGSEVAAEMGSEVNEIKLENPGTAEPNAVSDARAEIDKEIELINDAGSKVDDEVESDIESPVLLKNGNVLLSSLRCKLCKISFKNKYELYAHAVSHRVFKCDICQKILASAGSLKKHLLIAHSNQRDYMCELCGKSFKTPRCVQQHIGKVHANPRSRKNSEEPGPHICPDCGKVFESKRLLTKHKYYHKDRTTACPVCEKCFSGKGEMLYHLKHVHSDARNYSCSLCDKRYKTRSSLREHRTQHHMGREGWRHQCEFCNKMFNKKSQLTYHMKVHTGDKPFSCSHCAQTFTQKGNLYKHMQTVHIKAVQYACELCGKGFYLNENYKLHMRTHAVENGTAAITGNKYGRISHCTICGRYFPRTCTYKAHLLMHKEEWKYSCPICKKKFVTITSCTRHLKTHLKCRMSSLEIREKFALKIGATEPKASSLLAQIKEEMGKEKSSPIESKGVSKVKPIIIKRSGLKGKDMEAHGKTKKYVKLIRNTSATKVVNPVKLIRNASESYVVSPTKSTSSDHTGVVGRMLESLASGGGMVEESADVTHNLVPILDDASVIAANAKSINSASIISTAVQSIINTPSTSKDESSVDAQSTSSALQSLLMGNVNNVMHLDDKEVAADAATSVEENVVTNETEEMSNSELNEILQTVNSQDFLQQLGSGNILLVQQGETKAYVMLS